MLTYRKVALLALAAFVTLALLSGSLAWAKRPPKDPPPEPEPPVTYAVTLLDTFVSTAASAINSLGHVVGYAYLTPEDRYYSNSFACLFTPETGIVDLNTLLPEGSTWHLAIARDINDQGQIVGFGYVGDDTTRRAFRFTPATETSPAIVDEFQLYPGSQMGDARGINEYGDVCGYTLDADGNEHIWFYSDVLGEMVNVLTAPSDEWFYPRSINDSCQVLIDAVTADISPSHVIRVMPFGDPEYFTSQNGVLSARDMNESGHFVGYERVEVPVNRKRTRIEDRAILHDGVSLIDLGIGVGSGANGINDNGDIVGSYYTDFVVGGNAFVYLNEYQQVVNLDDAIVASESVSQLWFDETTTIVAGRINDSGVIIGELVNEELLPGRFQTIILTPMP